MERNTNKTILDYFKNESDSYKYWKSMCKKMEHENSILKSKLNNQEDFDVSMEDEEIEQNIGDRAGNANKVECNNESTQSVSNIKGKRRSYTLDLKQQAVELRNSGKSLKTIADELGCKKSSVRDWLNQTEKITDAITMGYSNKRKLLEGGVGK